MLVCEDLQPKNLCVLPEHHVADSDTHRAETIEKQEQLDS